MCHLPASNDPNVLVGTKTSDDAGVYRLTDDIALVQTLDFITPIVDDPFVYGQVAAANSLSDVYAMGGTPVVAMNIVCFPSRKVPMESLGRILEGGASKTSEAGIEIIGGHSVDDQEPKYGLVVTGRVDPNRIYTNAGARAGDHLILTKPIGTGILTTAIKKRKIDGSDTDQVIESMTTLNRLAADALVNFRVHAVTDITGFGLLGHLHELVEGAGLGARLDYSNVPVMEHAIDLVKKRVVPGGSKRNLRRVEQSIDWASGLSDEASMILCDPQTSGGLLISCHPEDVSGLIDALKEMNALTADVVGEMVEDSDRRIRVES